MADIESVRLPDNSTFNIKDPTALHGTDGINALADVSASSPSDSDLLIYNGSTSKWTAQANPFTKPNVYENPWFKVNERGFTSGTLSTVIYPSSMWIGTCASGGNDGSIAATSDGLQFTVGGAAIYLQQNMENFDYKIGEIYTFSALMSDGTIKTKTAEIIPTVTTFSGGMSGLAMWLYPTGLSQINVYNNQTIRAVKLEKGTISTLGNDTEPNKTLETLACQKADFSQIAYQNLDATTARKAYNAGQYFFNADGDFCRAKTDILLGATLTEGTNYEKTTVAVEMAYNNISTGITGVTAHICGNIVVLQIQKQFSESLAGWKSLGTLPNALKPKSAPIYFCGIDNSATSHATNHPINCGLSSLGEIKVYVFSDKLDPNLFATVTYIR